MSQVWNKTANGVWTCLVGSPGAPDLLSHSGAAPKLDGLSALPSQAFPWSIPVDDNYLDSIKKAVDGLQYCTSH